MIEYYYIFTVAYTNTGGALSMHTMKGQANVVLGTTRESVLEQVYEKMISDMGVSAASIVFFSLEPNRLGAV